MQKVILAIVTGIIFLTLFNTYQDFMEVQQLQTLINYEVDK